MNGAPSLRRQRLVGGAFVAVMVAIHIAWMGRATFVLSLGLVVAYLVWLARASSPLPAAARVLRPYLAGIAVMGLHSAEEYFTGFQRQFPSFFSYEWGDGQFVAFNALWLVLFLLAALGVRLRVNVAHLVVWFFALVAGIGNGIGHLLLSLSQARYFPGTATAPLCLVVGIILVRGLARSEPIQPGVCTGSTP